MTNKDIPVDPLKGSELEFATIEGVANDPKDDKGESDTLKPKTPKNIAASEKRTGEVRREGKDRREMIRFEDERRDGDERRKDSGNWD
jgi:hypothetical protein